MERTDSTTSVTPEAARVELATHAKGTDSPSAPPPDDQLGIAASYFMLRAGLAGLAFALPVVLVLGVGTDHLQTSLSAYYHFSALAPRVPGAGTMRDVFVGILCAVGLLLWLYKGYSQAENIALDIAGIAAVGIAVLPMDWPPCWIRSDCPPTSLMANAHSACALLFFAMTALVCVWRAKDTLPLLKNPPLERRFQRIYTGLGVAMVVIPTSVFIANRAGWRVFDIGFDGRGILIAEVIGVYVFATYWLVKSREIRRILGP